MTEKCNIQDCKNDCYEDHQECVLHCDKNTNDSDQLLHDFYDKLQDLIIRVIYPSSIDCIDGQTNISYNLLNSYFNNEIVDNEVLRKEVVEYLKIHQLYLFGIKMPSNRYHDAKSYTDLFKPFSTITFDECDFYNSSFNNINVNPNSLLGEIKIRLLFKACNFYNIFTVDNFTDEYYNDFSKFDNCVFYKKVWIYGLIGSPLFSRCSFKNDLSFNLCHFTNKPFNNGDWICKDKITSIEILNCNFDDKFILNKHEVTDFRCEKTMFKNKFEFEENKVNQLKIFDCNFYKVSDCFGSEFTKFSITKSIFEDFIGFEQCKFGIDDNSTDNPANFEYVTFESIINFRGAEFKNGLNIETINPKEPPNFFGVMKIDHNGTNRETFRIVKHSFDSVGNFIEANKFFKMEMEKYQEELKTNMNWDNFWLLLVFWFNKLTSNFGQSWIKPIGWIIFSVTIYTLNKYNYENNAYEIYKIDDLSSSIIIKCANAFADAIIPFQNLLDKDFNLKFISLIYGIFTSILIYQTIIALKRLTKR